MVKSGTEMRTVRFRRKLALPSFGMLSLDRLYFQVEMSSRLSNTFGPQGKSQVWKSKNFHLTLYNCICSYLVTLF